MYSYTLKTRKNHEYFPRALTLLVKLMNKLKILSDHSDVPPIFTVSTPFHRQLLAVQKAKSDHDTYLEGMPPYQRVLEDHLIPILQCDRHTNPKHSINHLIIYASWYHKIHKNIYYLSLPYSSQSSYLPSQLFTTLTLYYWMGLRAGLRCVNRYDHSCVHSQPK